MNFVMIFPVIAFNKEKEELYVFLQEDELKVTSEELLYQEKVFEGIEFIDSLGKVYKIISVKKTGWGNAFFGYSLTRKGRLIKVDFELKEDEQIDIQDFKKMVVEWAKKKHPYFDEIEKSLFNTKSYQEIIDLLV